MSLLSFAVSFALGEQAPARLFAPETLRSWSEAGGGWFQAEALRMLHDMSDPEADPVRVRLHPAIPLLVQPVVAALQALLSLDVRTAVALCSGLVAAATCALMFLTLQRLGRDVVEAALLCLLMLASAAWLFFYSVPVAAQLGGLSIVLVLHSAAGPALASPRREVLRQGLLSIATLSVTATNWMFSGLLGFARLHRLQALALAVAAGTMVLVLHRLPLQEAASAAPPVLVPSAGSSTGSSIEGSGVLSVSKSFWIDTLLAPQPLTTGRNPYWQGLSMQTSRPGSGSPLGLPALLLWGALLAAGVWGLGRSSASAAFKCVLVGGIAGQWLLQVFQGGETFLHSLHVLPLLLLLASFAFEGKGLSRRRALLGTLLLGTLLALHNGRVLAGSEAHLAAQGSARTAVLEEMERRPLGPWPRGKAHLLLGVPGAALRSKAYLEPAGAFSPWIGSFGVSFWLTGEEGQLLQAAESLPLRGTQQRLRLEAGRWPGADFTTPLYAGRWQQQPDGTWLLDLKPQPLRPGQRLELVLRAVGPAAGPVHHLQSEGRTLRVNARWALDLPEGSRWHLGDEQQGFLPESDLTEVESEGGWAYARAVLPREAAHARVRVRALSPPAFPEGPPVGFPRLQLPDADFAASVNAQVQHLAMSVEGRETRPGDPLHYESARVSDSASIVVALARAGSLALARRLSADLAERDFSGAWGSEADAPGWALWALEEIATRLSDPGFERAIWPHVQRKASWLLECMSASSMLLAEPQGPVLPRLVRSHEARLVCLPPQRGLLAGRVEDRVPSLYLTAVSYRGLSDAAALARRLGQEAEARRWSEAAGQLRSAWRAEVTGPGSGRPGYLALSRWMMAGAAAQGFQGARHAAALWFRSRAAGGDVSSELAFLNGWGPGQGPDPSRAGFAPRQTAGEGGAGSPALSSPAPGVDLAFAHQGLLLDEMAPAWEALRRLWSHQTAPGSYSWQGGRGEPYGSHRWEGVRGWVEPSQVTPHYRTAAEVLALQLDMLTRLDHSGTEPVVVIGAGVPPAWRTSTLTAHGIFVRGARIDWRWQDGRMEVTVIGKPWRVRLADGFPPHARLLVHYREAPPSINKTRESQE